MKGSNILNLFAWNQSYSTKFLCYVTVLYDPHSLTSDSGVGVHCPVNSSSAPLTKLQLVTWTRRPNKIHEEGNYVSVPMVLIASTQDTRLNSRKSWSWYNLQFSTVLDSYFERHKSPQFVKEFSSFFEDATPKSCTKEAQIESGGTKRCRCYQRRNPRSRHENHEIRRRVQITLTKKAMIRVD